MDQFQALVDVILFKIDSFEALMVVVSGLVADWSWWSIGGGQWSVVAMFA